MCVGSLAAKFGKRNEQLDLAHGTIYATSYNVPSQCHVEGGMYHVGSNSGYRQTSIIDLGWSLAIGKCAVAARCSPQVLILCLETSSQSGQERDELTRAICLKLTGSLAAAYTS